MAASTSTRHAPVNDSGTPPRASRRQPFDRRELERRGWRTTLEYRENHQRDAAGLLGSVEAEWRAEGERLDDRGDVVVVTASGPSPAAAWRRLRVLADSEPSPSPAGRIRSVASR